MTIVRVRFTPNGVPTAGRIQFQLRHDTDTRPLAAGRDILNGRAEWETVPAEGADIEVLPSEPGFHCVVRAEPVGHNQVNGTFLIPATGPVDFGSLVRYDPKAGMAYEPDPEWWAWVKDIQDKGGVPGDQGPQGKTAYQVAVEGGFVGTESAWLASLKGPPGQKGDPGSGATDVDIAAFVDTEGTLTARALSSKFAGQLKVTAYGDGVGAGSTSVDTAAFVAALDAARAIGAEVVFPSGASYNINSVAVTGGEKIRVEAGAEVVAVSSSGTLLSGGGSLSTTTTTATGTTKGLSSVTVGSTSGLAVSDVILVHSESNVVPGTATRRGYLRRIMGISGNVLTVDGPWPFSLTGDRVLTKVNMSAPIEVRSMGRIRGVDPLGVQNKALFDLQFVDSPILEGTNIGPLGGPCQQLTSCLGGYTQANTHDLSDFGSHYGYAVNWSGATRGHAIVGGSATRVRHGVTTTGAASVLGEPESNVALPAFVISECKNAGMDTHEQGVGNALLATVVNCTIGAQDRATDTVLGGTVSGANLYGYHIAAASVGAVLLFPVVLNMGTDSGAAAFRIRSECELESPFYPVATANAVQADADYTVRGGGKLAGGTLGAGVRKHGLLGRSAVTPNGGTDILQQLVDIGVLTAGQASILSGLVSLTASGTVQGRQMRAVATGVTDIPFRSDAPGGLTGDLAQYRTGGVSRLRVGPNGEPEITGPGLGYTLRSPNNTWYRITVSNTGTLSATAI